METAVDRVAEKTWHDLILQIQGVLNFQLFELDGHGVSVGKLITGFVLLFLGWLASKRAAKEVDQRLLGRISMDPSLRFTFRRLIFYFFFFITTLFTLRTLNVPITIFTVVGGALAVGIGFGSQNLVNNFISGILVMVERPMRVGDFIEIDGVSGTVTNIGIRSTMIRTNANASIIIPNTSLIEKNLTNWSYSSTVSDFVRIGVAYGTDLKLLAKVVKEATKSVEGLEKGVEASLVFQDFGDNALILDIAYDIASHQYTTRRRIQSDLRFKLNELFNEQGISVPFPQRDIHIVDGAPRVLQSRNHV